jgi:hypothetical protein
MAQVVDMVQISQEVLFYNNEYENAKNLEDFVDCTDLKTEFDIYFNKYLETQDERLYIKLDDTIKSFYKRALPLIFERYKNVITKHEGKHHSYTKEKTDLNRIQREFEQNHLKISDYKEIFNELKKIVDEIEIKRSIEKNDLLSKLFWLLLGAIIGMLPTIFKLLGWINF